jgi:chromosome segregation ATPase
MTRHGRMASSSEWQHFFTTDDKENTPPPVMRESKALVRDFSMPSTSNYEHAHINDTQAGMMNMSNHIADVEDKCAELLISNNNRITNIEDYTVKVKEQLEELTKRLDNHGEIHKTMTEGWGCIKKSLYEWQDHVNDIEQYVSIHHAEYEEMNDRVEKQTSILNDRVVEYSEEVTETLKAVMSLNRELVDKLDTLQKRVARWETYGLVAVGFMAFLLGYICK